MSYVTIFLTTTTSSKATTKLNYIELQNLRISNEIANENWVYKSPGTEPSLLFSSLFISINPKIINTWNYIKSEDLKQIVKAIDNSFLSPYDATSRFSIGFNIKKIALNLETNGSGLFIVNNPVFPSVSLFLNHEYALTLYYKLRYNKILLRPSLHSINRKTIRRTYTLGEIIDGSAKIEFNKVIPIPLKNAGRDLANYI